MLGTCYTSFLLLLLGALAFADFTALLSDSFVVRDEFTVLRGFGCLFTFLLVKAHASTAETPTSVDGH